MGRIQIPINTRQKSILFALLEAEGHLTLAEISKKTQLSPRIIRYNMETTRLWFQNEGVPLVVISGYGFEVKTTAEEKQKLLLLLTQLSVPNISFTRAQRQRIGILELLLSQTAVSYQSLAAYENISRSTVIKDIIEKKKWLGKRNLTLKSSPNKGNVVSGGELQKRYALIHLIHEELGEQKYLTLWLSEGELAFNDYSVPSRILEFFEELPLAECREDVEEIERRMGCTLNLDSKIELLLYLAISVTLNQNQQAKITSRNQKNAQERKENGLAPCIEIEIANQILLQLEEKFKLHFPKEENGYLAIFLLASKWEIRSEQPSDDLDADYFENKSIQLTDDCFLCADIITGACSSLFHPLLQTDSTLLMDLARHFQPILQRLKYDLPIVNANTEIIRTEYPEIFRGVESQIGLIEEALGKKIPVDEIANLVIYMATALDRLQLMQVKKMEAVLIGYGDSMKAKYLQNKLQLIFPSIKIIRIIHKLPVSCAEVSEVDLVLSLLPAQFLSFPVINVSLFPNSNEIKRIQNKIAEIEERNRGMFFEVSRKPNLLDLLRNDNILLCESVSSWQELVEIGCSPLLQKRAIEPGYVHEIIRITEEYGPYALLAPGVILLHGSPGTGVNQLCLSMVLLENGVDFGTTEKIDVALVLGAFDNHSHLDALFQLSKLFGNADFCQKLRQCGKSADVLRIIWTFLFN